MTRLASAVAATIWLIVPFAGRADVMMISGSFSGLQGVAIGSFNTDGACSVCQAADGLSNFSFSILGDAFDLERMTYLRATNSLTGSLTRTDQRLVFTPSGNLQFQDKEDGLTVVLHGDYAISGAAPAEVVPALDDASTTAASSGSPSPLNIAVTAITAIPEPGAWLFLGTVVVGLAAARFLRSRSQRTPYLPS